jgi:hypothetical protein
MPSESEPEKISETPGESAENKLCVGCMFPNEPDVHFCANCGAPMTSYAAIGPFELLFAEGHVYRQADENPRRFVVVLGVWVIFGMMALGCAALLFMGPEMGLQYLILGAVFLPVSLVMIWKTTRNIFLKEGLRRGTMPNLGQSRRLQCLTKSTKRGHPH